MSSPLVILRKGRSANRSTCLFSTHLLPNARLTLAALLAFGTLGAACIRQAGAEIARASAEDPPAREIRVQVGKGGTLLPDRWFHLAEEYVRNPAVNPEQLPLTRDELDAVRQILADASLELDLIQQDCSRRQMEIAKQYVDEGRAERYVPDQSDTSKREFAAVVVAVFDESGPWLVRIPEDDLPEFTVWRTAFDEIKSAALNRIRQLVTKDPHDPRGPTEVPDPEAIPIR